MKRFGARQGAFGALLAVVIVGCAVLASTAVGSSSLTADHGARRGWVATWAASPQLPSDAAFTLFGEPTNPGVRGFNNQTVRNVVFTSVGGNEIRVQVSNAYGTQAVTIAQTTVGAELAGAQLVPGSVRSVTFGGSSSVTVPAGSQATSDPIRFRVRPLEDLAVSLYLPNATGQTTYHLGAEQINYVASGNQAASEAPDSYSALPSTSSLGSSWYYVSGVFVRSPRSSRRTVVAVGDSITDGFNSQLNANDRWPNLLARRLVATVGDRAPGVVDEAISGNRVLNDSVCFGQSALARFDRDVLSVPGVRDVILLEGINDTRFPDFPNAGCFAPNTYVSANDIIHGYRQLIAAAHARGVRIFGATLTPSEGNANTTAAGEAEREAVNHWIRTSGAFDGVFDFDNSTRNPDDPLVLDPTYDSGDHLHPNDAGHQAMANAVSLSELLH